VFLFRDGTAVLFLKGLWLSLFLRSEYLRILRKVLWFRFDGTLFFFDVHKFSNDFFQFDEPFFENSQQLVLGFLQLVHGDSIPTA
jgi:hypothetical protein